MRFNAKNASGATVHDLADPRGRIERVLWVDTRTNTVAVVPGRGPLLTAQGRVRKRLLRFELVWPIYAGRRQPVMFQCVGRLGDAP